jgi:hypothetical protein
MKKSLLERFHRKKQKKNQKKFANWKKLLGCKTLPGHGPIWKKIQKHWYYMSSHTLELVIYKLKKVFKNNLLLGVKPLCLTILENGKVCSSATSEAWARLPRSISNFSDFSETVWPGESIELEKGKVVGRVHFKRVKVCTHENNWAT